MLKRDLRCTLHFVASAAALTLALWAADRMRGLSELPPDLRAAEVAYPASMGTTAVGSPAEVRFLAQSRPIGSTIEIRSEHATHRARLVPQLSRLHFTIVLVVGLTFFVVNLLVFCPRVDRRPVRDFYWCTLLYGLALLVGGMYYPSGPGWSEWILPLVWLGCLAALPVFFVHMSLTFPKRWDLLDRYPGVMRALVILAAALFLWQAVGYLRYVSDPGPAAWQALLLPRTLAGIYLVAAVAAGCFVLYRSGRTLELSREREQTKWLLWGFTIGVTPYVFLRTLPGLVGISSRIPPELDRIFELAIPMAFTFAVVRYRFLDIDIIIRRSLIYGILAGVLAMVYLLVVTVAGQRLVERFPAYAMPIQTLAIAVPFVLFGPTRRRIGGWVDRTFFQIRYNFSQALYTLEVALRRASSQEEIASVTQSFVAEQLGLQRAVVIARRRSSTVLSGAGGQDTMALDLDRFEGPLAGTAELLASPNSTSRPDLETSTFPATLLEAGARILVPLRSEGRILGVIAIGDKRSERRFVQEDLQLLNRVRVEAQTALERVELVQIAAEETLEREKIQALEAMKSDFFARIAHDLRIPLTSIRWTVENLLDGVGAPTLDPRCAPQLQSVLASSKLLGRLMNNLLDLSRLDNPSHAMKTAEISLSEIVQEAVELVRPAGQTRGVRFHACLSSGLSPVAGDRDRIHEVLANLLENAVRYSPDQQTVEVALRSTGDGRQILTIRDHGPGLADEARNRIFDRFEQGAPSPYSKQLGFGLGLYIAREFMAAMRGSIEARNHPEGGACFECMFREWEGT